MSYKKILGFLGSILLFSSMAATTVAAQEEKPVEGGTLDVGFISDVRTLDPLRSTQWTERQILFLIYDKLIDLNSDFSIKPGLAKSWDFENNDKRVVLHLREGIKFHDGTRFDAKAVKWNLDTRLDPNSGSSQYRLLGPVVDSVDVLDDYTVAINLKKPYSPLLSLLADRAGLMASPTAAEKYGEDIGSHPVGTGPFKFEKWTRGSEIDLVKNEDFWQENKPYLDGIDFHIISSNVVGIQRMATGEIDYIGQLTPLDTKLAEASPDIKLVKSNGGPWYSLQLRYDSSPYSNPDLRKAIAYAINRDRINQILWEGKGIVSDGFTPQGLWWEPTDLVHYDYDPERARQILKDANLEGTSLSLAAPSGDALRRFSELVKEDLDAVGLNVQLAPVPQSEYYAKTVAGEIHFTPMRWTQRADPDGLIQYLFSSEGTANSTGYQSDQVDAWINEARTSSDQKERKSLYDKIQHQISEDLPYISIGFSSEFSALSKNVHGFSPMPDQIPRYRYLWMGDN